MNLEDFIKIYASGDVDIQTTIPEKPIDFQADFLEAPLPNDHNKRTQVLNYTLSLPEDVKSDLESIVETASRTFNMPYVLVNVVDDKHLHPYATVNYPLNDLDREGSFCGHAILNVDRPLIVPDTKLDWRFANNPYSRSNIRFYAGSPIRMRSPQKGNDEEEQTFAMGTVCLLDEKPRILDQSQINQLNFLADMVQCIFEKRLYLKLIQTREEMSKLLVDFINKVGKAEEESAEDFGCKILAEALRIAVTDVSIEKTQSKVMKKGDTIDVRRDGIEETETKAEAKIKTITLKNEGTSDIWESDDFRENAIVVIFSLQQSSDYYRIVCYTDDPSRVFDMYDKNYVIQFGEALSAFLQHDLVSLSNRAKTVFIESVSHELRTPLHGILSSVELLQESDTLLPNDGNLLSMVQFSAKNLINIINGLLDFHKFETGLTHVNKDVVNLFDLQQEIADALAISVSDECTLILDSDLPLESQYVKADVNIMRQVLLNLVGNAVKFTKKGTVTFIMTSSGESLTWIVEDTGIGMDSQFIEQNLFRPFSKADALTQGIGLGLATCKLLCGASDSDLELIRSQPDKGSVFRYSLPVEWLTSASTKYAYDWKFDRPLSDSSIVQMTVRFLTQYLHMEGASSSSKFNSKSLSLLHVIDYASEKDNDIEKFLRKEMVSNKSNAVILVCRPEVVTIIPDTISNHPNVVIAHQPLGPLRLMALVQKIDSQQEERRKQEKNLSILIVDDNAVNRNILVAYCKKRKVTHNTATDGLEAFEKFKRSRYDIILMDIQMPICDGPTSVAMIRNYELQNQNQKMRTAKQTPCIIIMLTGLGSDEVRQDCLEKGANDFYVKPISIKLLDRILDNETSG